MNPPFSRQTDHLAARECKESATKRAIQQAASVWNPPPSELFSRCSKSASKRAIQQTASQQPLNPAQLPLQRTLAAESRAVATATSTSRLIPRSCHRNEHQPPNPGSFLCSELADAAKGPAAGEVLEMRHQASYSAGREC